ncbi:MAG: reverse transcriptase-like protein [Candidatus Paceibacterota bacterium]
MKSLLTNLSLHKRKNDVFFGQISDVIIQCDGFLKYKDYRNGCSVAIVEKGIAIYKKIYLLENLKSKDLKMFAEKEKITNNVVEYFAIYCAILLAGKYKIPFIYSDSELCVKQLMEDWTITKEHLKVWNKLCKKHLKKYQRIVWISRKANVLILGH